MPVWKKTNLSVTRFPHQMADTDRIAFHFPAGETVASVNAHLEILPELTDADVLIESAVINATFNGAIITVTGLTRGVTYELSWTFVRADDTTWTRTLVLECVA